ncbi:hypothetical protein IU427_26255 [Nocardia beijingensis]|uniref:Thiazolylpeptide-type bacteriocin n=1 Tax=Nocardia sputorum TaxID=2984338 RepID=A0ABN6U6T2_9NOCA|nr:MULTISPECIES: hypothetical protein [Nocardia]MBF6468638.1 hypothetical protein [Nocardia beijingensis]BDT92263.1 hypothetical protein IFM12275_22390 [Nocardia sputorum]BDU00866.1 hypothetical protein IFM12276_38940 [Nocardia sputorum]
MPAHNNLSRLSADVDLLDELQVETLTSDAAPHGSQPVASVDGNTGGGCSS